MSEKRRDSKNRVLRNGESQRKDGRYAYVYVDSQGKQRFLYSWKLESTDKLPQGKRECIALREKIKQVQKDLDDGIIPYGGGITVGQLAQKFLSQKVGARYNTETNYKNTVKLIQSDEFGAKYVDKVKLSDAKKWVIKLQEDGKKYGTIKTIVRITKSIFQVAVDDDLIRKNPFLFKLSTVILNDTVPKKALTKKQEQDFLNFIKNHRIYWRYYDAVYILFNTGLRISELAGLTKKNIDLKNGIIKIEHQLQRTGDMKFYIGEPKSDSGVRCIPMIYDVKECFINALAARKNPKIEPLIDGVSGFVFLGKRGNPTYSTGWSSLFRSMLKKYNECHSEQIESLTPHICRHTFCSNMAAANMNPNVLQYIMGHSDISITLRVYAHVQQYEDVQNEMQRVVGL